MLKYSNVNHYREFRVGSPALCPTKYTMEELISKDEPKWPVRFVLFKTIFDYICALIAVPLILIMALALCVLNPLFNPGPIFFSQERVGRFGKVFRMWKFRTMLVSDAQARRPNSAVEKHRITKLGHILRKTRLDEVPNLINVLRGEMSVIGPRPDAKSHFSYYLDRVQGYSERHRIKPGITGLAQVEQGYVESEDATAIKAKYDNLYVDRSCELLDIYIIARTFRVMTGGIGAK